MAHLQEIKLQKFQESPAADLLDKGLLKHLLKDRDLKDDVETVNKNGNTTEKNIKRKEVW